MKFRIKPRKNHFCVQVKTVWWYPFWMEVDRYESREAAEVMLEFLLNGMLT